MDAKKRTSIKNSTADDAKDIKPVLLKTPKREVEEKKPVMAKEILQEYISKKPASFTKYTNLCQAMSSFETWSEEARVLFIEQFLDIYDLLDANCTDLVLKFCKIRWHKVPVSTLPSFVQFLISLAHDVHHVGVVLGAFVAHFAPILDTVKATTIEIGKKGTSDETLQPAIDEQSQEAIYGMAHTAISDVIASSPLSTRILIKCCVKQFPHIKQPLAKWLPFVRNLIRMADCIGDEEVAEEIWSLIVDRLLHIDAAITDLQDEERRLSFCNRSDLLVSSQAHESESSSNEEGGPNEVDSAMETKLDSLVALVITRLCGPTEAIPFAEHRDDVNFKSLAVDLFPHKAHTNRDQCTLFRFLLASFDEHVLAADGVHSVPFIWFYVCSLSNENTHAILDFLWEVLQSSVECPNEWKKAHNAAAFLCGFLARANYIDLELACTWMQRISGWCRDYVEGAKARKELKPGAVRDGTFYAVVQALLFVFCYRHRELREQNALSQIVSFGLDEIVHSSLEPLRFISQGVALCFLSLNRQLESVKSRSGFGGVPSAGSFSRTRRRITPVELFFPFSFCQMRSCSSLIHPLMRRFNFVAAQGARGGTNTFGEMDAHDGEDNGDDTFEEEEDGGGGGVDMGMTIDEGYEEELMCGQTVSDFTSSYLSVLEEEYAEGEDERMEA